MLRILNNSLTSAILCEISEKQAGFLNVHCTRKDSQCRTVNQKVL